MAYPGFERLMKRCTDGYIFESKYIADEYQRKIGSISKPARIIYNGLNEEEFTPVSCQKACKNFVFVGELRKLKGIEVILNAMSRLTKLHDVSLMIFGSGPDAEFFSSLIRELELESSVTLMPPVFLATRAFSQAECVVVPSIKESMPYIVLEAAAAQVPLLATNVGGIPEIFGPYAHHLVPSGDPVALADEMLSFLDNHEHRQKVAHGLHVRIKSEFRVESMATEILKLYEQALLST
jgi:glycosyltransferase involved in cell wall biosynthesis